jgi:hypothetical protein
VTKLVADRVSVGIMLSIIPPGTPIERQDWEKASSTGTAWSHRGQVSPGGGHHMVHAGHRRRPYRRPRPGAGVGSQARFAQSGAGAIEPAVLGRANADADRSPKRLGRTGRESE